MEILQVLAKSKEYPIYIDKTYENLAECFRKAKLCGQKAVLITDSHVSKCYGEEIKKILDTVFSETTVCVFQYGEENKTLATIEMFYEHFVENQLDRKSVVVALGGGVTGDMAGFAAATYMRGIRFVQLPTTLLAQVDSGVGGKTGVDFLTHKNMVGAFWQPEFVFANVATMRTLPQKEFVSGLSEVLKHGFISDKLYLKYIVDNKEAIFRLEEEALVQVVLGSCRIKAQVVNEDETESGKREILNFGHTFGHAIESLLEFGLPHGHCVALGMVCALWLSCQKGHISPSEYEFSISALAAFLLPVRLETPLLPKDILRQMYKDKKVKTNTITLVLLNQLGEAYCDASISELQMLESIENILCVL